MKFYCDLLLLLADFVSIDSADESVHAETAHSCGAHECLDAGYKARGRASLWRWSMWGSMLQYRSAVRVGGRINRVGIDMGKAVLLSDAWHPCAPSATTARARVTRRAYTLQQVTANALERDVWALHLLVGGSESLLANGASATCYSGLCMLSSSASHITRHKSYATRDELGQRLTGMQYPLLPASQV